MTAEEWRPVLGYEGSYEVSDLGRVRSLTRKITDRTGVARTWHGRPITPGVDAEGRLQARLHLNGKASIRRVHRLVLESFVSPRPEGLEGCHNDGDKLNNRLDNLRWDDRSSNMQDRVRHGGHHQAKKTHCPEGHSYSGDNLESYVTASGKKQRRCRTCHRTKQRVRERQKYTPWAQLDRCPGSGQRTYRPPSPRDPDRCPVCGRLAYVRVDGTTGYHPVKAAREKRLAAAKGEK